LPAPRCGLYCGCMATMSLVGAALGAVTLLLLGLAMGGTLSAQRMERRLHRMAEEMRSHETEFKRLTHSAERLRAEKQGFNNFLVTMSEFARELNTALDSGKLAHLLLRIVDQMFQPQQIMIFYLDKEGDRLHLAASKGLPDKPAPMTKVRVGEGKIGWVAEHQRVMDRQDFMDRTNVEGIVTERDPANMRLDLLAPMVHDSHTVGVICIGGVELQLAAQKKMLKMAADLGSAALHSAMRFKVAESSAAHDGLTNLFNKKQFLMELADMIIQAEQGLTPLSVFLFDIDHFKTYNDTNGHLAGDEVLRATGRLLRDLVAEMSRDFRVARFGGEEFILAMPGMNREQAFECSEKVRLAILRHRYPYEQNQPEGDLTISGGIASMPEDGRSSTELLSSADEALYRAKAKGRNRVEAHQSAQIGAERDEVYYEAP